LAGDRGSVSAELAIATPLLLLMLLLIVQFAVWSQATHIAQAAAAQGLAAARVQNGTTAAGHAQAQHLLDQLARGPLATSQVAVQRSATTASVEITGHAASVIPFVHLSVHADASGPVEAWSDPATPDG
jgi:Flp pilus assembly protein TadG